MQLQATHRQKDAFDHRIADLLSEATNSKFRAALAQFARALSH